MLCPSAGSYAQWVREVCHVSEGVMPCEGAMPCERERCHVYELCPESKGAMPCELRSYAMWVRELCPVSEGIMPCEGAMPWEWGSYALWMRELCLWVREKCSVSDASMSEMPHERVMPCDWCPVSEGVMPCELDAPRESYALWVIELMLHNC